MTMSNEAFLKTKSFVFKYGAFYAIGLLIAFGLKYYYSGASSEDLDWILAPTAYWVQALSGIPFEKEQQIGFVSHFYQFIIAPSCAGINFMIIAFSTLLFSFIHRLKSVKGRFLWIASSFLLVYLFTILVNSLRIILSIFLLRLDIYGGWITPERVHTIEGTIVYFVSLLILYVIAGELIKYFALNAGKNKVSAKAQIHLLHKWFPPVFFYFAITLGVPVLNGAYVNDSKKFLDHAVLITAVCLTVLLLLSLLFILKKHLREKSVPKTK